MLTVCWTRSGSESSTSCTLDGLPSNTDFQRGASGILINVIIVRIGPTSFDIDMCLFQSADTPRLHATHCQTLIVRQVY